MKTVSLELYQLLSLRDIIWSDKSIGLSLYLEHCFPCSTHGSVLIWGLYVRV